MGRCLSAGIGLLIAMGLGACANTNCRALADQKGEAPPPIKKELDPMAKTSAADRVFVSKDDGSLQCNQGIAISPAEMQKEFGTLPVYSSSKRNDGMMRIQVCGAPTGAHNVFEIDRANLALAIKLGFSEWLGS